MKYIKSYLDQLKELSPIPPEVSPELKYGQDIEAFIFDIYGTLLISASGDIDKAEVSTHHLKSALDAANIEILNGQEKEVNERLKTILDDFLAEIRDYLEVNRAEDALYPEVNILGIWEEVLSKAVERKWIRMKTESDLQYMTFIFELLSNHVYPMPGMKEVVHRLQEAGKVLGIVSNSQFYTPMIMNYFMGNEKLDSEEIKPFDPDLTVYSYKLLKAKPDISLFSRILPVLKDKYGLEPGQALFIGNDMYNDIYPAHRAGLKTALFAGDKRSLRWRKEKKEIRDIAADMIITRLEHLLELIEK